MTWAESEREAPFETIVMEEDHSTSGQRETVAVRTKRVVYATKDLLDPSIICG